MSSTSPTLRGNFINKSYQASSSDWSFSQAFPSAVVSLLGTSPTSTLRGAPHPSGSAEMPPPPRSHPFHGKEVSVPPLFLLPSRCLERGSQFVIIYSIAHLQLPSQCTFSCMLRRRGAQIESVSFITISPARSQAQSWCSVIEGWMDEERRKRWREGGS